MMHANTIPLDHRTLLSDTILILNKTLSVATLFKSYSTTITTFNILYKTSASVPKTYWYELRVVYHSHCPDSSNSVVDMPKSRRSTDCDQLRVN